MYIISFISPDYYVITRIISKLIISIVIKKKIKSALETSGLSSWSLSQILYHEVTITPPPPQLLDGMPIYSKVSTKHFVKFV